MFKKNDKKKEAFKALMSYCTAMECTAQIEFLLDFQRVHNLDETLHELNLFRKMYQKYFSYNSPTLIRLPYMLTRKIQNEMHNQDYGLELLDEVRMYIIDMIDNDIIPKLGDKSRKIIEHYRT